ncbi:MAG: RND transporter [Rhodobacteraceae bacterium]|nr:RND transporter [Paracoccaceae bacterium]
MTRFLDELPLYLVLIMALSIGLAPFTPEPHVWEKLKMLAAGELRRGVDIFDLCLHGAPWLLLLAKLGRMTALRLRG